MHCVRVGEDDAKEIFVECVGWKEQPMEVLGYCIGNVQ